MPPKCSRFGDPRAQRGRGEHEWRDPFASNCLSLSSILDACVGVYVLIHAPLLLQRTQADTVSRPYPVACSVSLRLAILEVSLSRLLGRPEYLECGCYMVGW